MSERVFQVKAPTEDIAHTVLQGLHDLGYMWASGDSLQVASHWGSYRDRTIYSAYSDHTVCFGHIAHDTCQVYTADEFWYVFFQKEDDEDLNIESLL